MTSLVARGADPRVIAMNFEGAVRLEVDDNGDLVFGKPRQDHSVSTSR
jgi:hypothetical protein